MEVATGSVLVIEEESALAEEIRTWLEGLGFEVPHAAHSREEARHRLRVERPDVALANIRLYDSEHEQDEPRALGTPAVYYSVDAGADAALLERISDPLEWVSHPFDERLLRAAFEVARYRHRMEHVLGEERGRRREAEEFRTLIDSVEGDAVCRLDTNGHIISWTEGAQRLERYEPERAIGMHISEFVPGEPGPNFIDANQALAQAAQEGRYEFEGWLVRGDGTCFWAFVVIGAMRDDEGNVIGFAKLTRDMSERRQAMDELRKSEDRFRKALVEAPVPMMLHGEDGRLLVVNDALLRASGYERESLRTVDDWLHLAHRGHIGEIHEKIVRAFQGSPPDSLELPVTLRSGEVRQWLFSVSAPIVMADGRRALVVVAVDVTQARQAEEALREEHRQKDQFIAMLGHELRNPLAAIRSATELLDHAVSDGEALSRIQAVLQRQTRHMARLVDGLLDVSRIVSGRISTEKRAVELCSVLRETMEDRLEALQKTRLELRSELETCPMWVYADRVRLVQAFDNLLSNAVRFTNPPGTIWIRSRREGECAVIEVRDTGVGIERELLPYIFEPFRQADQTLARASGGLGLGLAVVKGVVELHGGTVTAHSEGRGRGAQFTIRLPLSEGAHEQPRETPRQPTATRMLVVEDNHDAADLLGMLLERAGHEVAIAYDGKDALETAESFEPDVVLCDIGLPGELDGYDVARKLRARGDRDGALLVAITGYGRSQDIRRAQEAGFDAHLTKPVDVSDIERVVSERLGHGGHPEPRLGM